MMDNKRVLPIFNAGNRKKMLQQREHNKMIEFVSVLCLNLHCAVGSSEDAGLI